MCSSMRFWRDLSGDGMSVLWLIVGMVLGALALWLLVPPLIAQTLRRVLVRADQAMAYHLMNGRQLRALVGEVAPLAARWFRPAHAAAIARELRGKHQWQRKSIASQDLDKLVKSAELQNLFGLDQNELTAHLAPVDPEALVLQQPQAAAYHPLSPPLHPARLPAEWQAMKGALIHWPTGYPGSWKGHAALVHYISAEGEVHIVVRDIVWAKIVLAWLIKQETPFKNIRFILAPTDDLWVRDCGPTLVKTSVGDAAIVNAYLPNGLGYHKRDSEACIAVASAWGLPVHRLPLIVEGGNLVSDGEGGLFMCDSVFEHNPDIDEVGLRDIVHRWFGIDRLIILPSMPGDITGHADIVVKVAEQGVLLVSEAPRGHRWRDALEEVARRLAASHTAAGAPWVIHRLPMPSAKQEWTYVNALTLGSTIIVPSYDPVTDANAAEVFALASPDRTLRWIDYRAFNVGAVHCQTKEIPL
jgi:agmatine deiminase